MSVDTGAYDGVALAPSSGSNLTGSRDERSRYRDRDRRSERSRGRETDYHGSDRDRVRGDRIKRGVDRSKDRGPDRGPDHRGGDRGSNRGRDRDRDRDRDFLDDSPNNRDMAARDIDYREFNEPPDQYRRQEAHHSGKDDRDHLRRREQDWDRDQDQDQDRDWDRGDRDRSRDRSLELNLRDRGVEREEIPNNAIMVRGMPIETIQPELRNEVTRYGLEPKDTGHLPGEAIPHGVTQKAHRTGIRVGPFPQTPRVVKQRPTSQAPGKEGAGPVNQTLMVADHGGYSTGDGRTAALGNAFGAPQAPRARPQ